MHRQEISQWARTIIVVSIFMSRLSDAFCENIRLPMRGCLSLLRPASRVVPLDSALDVSIKVRQVALRVLLKRPATDVSVVDCSNAHGPAQDITDRDRTISFPSSRNLSFHP